MFIWENSHRREFLYGDDFLISYLVYMMTGSFHISLFEGTLHVDKMHGWFKIANITYALPVPVYRQTDFIPKRVVVSRLHDTIVRFRTCPERLDGTFFEPCPYYFSLDLHVTFKSMHNIYGVTLNEAFTAYRLDSTCTILIIPFL